MSEENIELIRRVNDSFIAGDWDEALSAYSENVELDTTRMPGGGIYRGPEGAREYFIGWLGAWDNFHAERLDLIDTGGTVVLLSRMSGTGKGSGAEVTMRTADVFTLEDGRIVRHVGYPDAAEALADLGLSEPSGR
jgi:ketosteroid isomerase-like protein